MLGDHFEWHSLAVDRQIKTSPPSTVPNPTSRHYSTVCLGKSRRCVKRLGIGKEQLPVATPRPTPALGKTQELLRVPQKLVCIGYTKGSVMHNPGYAVGTLTGGGEHFYPPTYRVSPIDCLEAPPLGLAYTLRMTGWANPNLIHSDASLQARHRKQFPPTASRESIY